MKIWVMIMKHNNHDFIHAQTSTYGSLRSAVQAVRDTPVYKTKSEGGQKHVDFNLMVDGVAEIDDYTFLIHETELNA